MVMIQVVLQEGATPVDIKANTLKYWAFLQLAETKILHHAAQNDVLVNLSALTLIRDSSVLKLSSTSSRVSA